MEVCVSTVSIIVGDDGQVFRLLNRVVIVGLFLRRANGVRPYRYVAVGLSVFYIQFSSFKQGAGSAFLCDQNLSSCSPNSRPQNVSSYTATLQDIRFGIISLYLSRKSPLLLHKKCNNCRNVVKLKNKSFVCTNYDVINCAVSHIRS